VVRRCGWCKAILGEKEPLKDKRETTGICEACKERCFGSGHVKEGV